MIQASYERASAKVKLMSIRNLFLLSVTAMVLTWALTYLAWNYEPTPNTLAQEMRRVVLVALLVTAGSQVVILAMPFAMRLIPWVLLKAK